MTLSESPSGSDGKTPFTSDGSVPLSAFAAFLQTVAGLTEAETETVIQQSLSKGVCELDEDGFISPTEDRMDGYELIELIEEQR
jgi:hypothetical protein